MELIFTSSANNLTVRPEPKMSTISLINIRKRTGPTTLPCGTPLLTGMQSDVLLLILTACIHGYD